MAGKRVFPNMQITSLNWTELTEENLFIQAGLEWQASPRNAKSALHKLLRFYLSTAWNLATSFPSSKPGVMELSLEEIRNVLGRTYEPANSSHFNEKMQDSVRKVFYSRRRQISLSLSFFFFNMHIINMLHILLIFLYVCRTALLDSSSTILNQATALEKGRYKELCSSKWTFSSAFSSASRSSSHWTYIDLDKQQ